MKTAELKEAIRQAELRGFIPTIDGTGSPKITTYPDGEKYLVCLTLTGKCAINATGTIRTIAQ